MTVLRNELRNVMEWIAITSKILLEQIKRH